MRTSPILFRLLLGGILVSACGKRGEEPCQPPAPDSFDFIVFDAEGKNSAADSVRTFNLVRGDTRSGIDIRPKTDRQPAYWSSNDLITIGLSGVKLFYFHHGGLRGDRFTDTLFVDVVPGTDCNAPRFQEVRLNGKIGTFEYGVGPKGAAVFRK